MNVAVARIVNGKLVQQVTILERQCWGISGIQNSVSREELKNIIGEIFSKIGVVNGSCKPQTCHRRKKDNQSIVEILNPKDSYQVFRVQKDLTNLVCTALDFPVTTQTFINKSLGLYYRALWNKCRKLKEMYNVHNRFLVLSCILVYFAVDLKKMFPSVDTEDL